MIVAGATFADAGIGASEMLAAASASGDAAILGDPDCGRAVVVAAAAAADSRAEPAGNVRARAASIAGG